MTNSIGSRYSSLSTMSSNSESTKSKTLGGLTPGSKEEKAALAELRHERLLFCLGSLLGTYVEVEVKGGSVFRGIFHGASKELGLCLKYCHLLEERTKTKKNVIETLVVEPKDFVQLIAKDVDFQNEDCVKASFSSHSDWNTDAEIAARTGTTSAGGARELQPFEEIVSLPEDASQGVTFGDLDSSVVPEWDQFALNKEKFGIKSTFKEELYTTKLDRSAPDFDAKLRKAEELAQQIRRAETTNIHLKEERGQELERDYDEELLYGAVVRENDAVESNQKSYEKKSTKSSMSVVKEELNGDSDSITPAESSYVSDFRQRTTEEFRRFKEEMDKKVKSSSVSKNENNEYEERINDGRSIHEDSAIFQLPKNVKDNRVFENSNESEKLPTTSRLNVHAAEFRPGQGFIYHAPNTGKFVSLSTNEVAKSNMHTEGVEAPTATPEEEEASSLNNMRMSYQSVNYPYGSYSVSAPFEGSPTFVPYNMTVGYNAKSGFAIPPNVTSPPMMGRNMAPSFTVPMNTYPMPNIPQTMNVPYYYGPGQQFYYATAYHGMLNPAHYVPNFPIPSAAVGSPVIGGFQPRSPPNDWVPGNDASPYLGPVSFPPSVRSSQRAAMGVPVSPKQNSEQTTGNESKVSK
ncbi:Polyadenylate-binding protein-interacting protein 4 [Galdieria sulphuraria]|nr:Polyadenylate-binding protein-interacting protein 4 [Galdieria sulphuraria]